MSRKVKQYVEGCDACQRNKNRTQTPAGKLMPNSIPEKPWSHISADFITKLPLAQGVINRPPEPKIVRLEGWEERELFSDGLDEGF